MEKMGLCPNTRLSIGIPADFGDGVGFYLYCLQYSENLP